LKEEGLLSRAVAGEKITRSVKGRGILGKYGGLQRGFQNPGEEATYTRTVTNSTTMGGGEGG